MKVSHREQCNSVLSRGLHPQHGCDVLNKAVQNPSALSDAAKGRVNIAVNQSGYASFNTGSNAPAQASSGTSRVQLRAPTGLVRVAGHEVTEAAAATLAETAPELVTRVRHADGKDEYLTVDPAAKAKEAAKEADTARAEEITREDLNRHPDDQIEAAHQHFVGEVSTQNQIALMVAAHRGEVPSNELLNRIASEMHEPLHVAIDKVNAISMATQAQFTVLARSMNLDADKAADWLREHRKNSAMVAAQAHGLRRDLLAWKPLLADYRAATGDGVKH
jgi:hypothetical protein